MTQLLAFLILTCLPAHLSRSSPFSLLFQLLSLLCEGKNRAARSLCSGVCLTRGRMMLSPVHLILAGRRTSSSGSSEAGRTWRRCKMEEAAARWMRHVSGCFHRTPHPSFPLLLFTLVPLSFTLPPPLLHLWAVAERLPPVSLSPSLHHRCSDYSAYSVPRPKLLALYVSPPSPPFSLSSAPNPSGNKTSLFSFLSLSSAVISPPVSAAVHYSSFFSSVCSSRCASQSHMRSVFTHTCTLTHSPSLSLCLWLPPYACGLFCLPTPHQSLSLSLFLSLFLSLAQSLSFSLIALSRCSTHCSASAGRITFSSCQRKYFSQWGTSTIFPTLPNPPHLNTHIYTHTHTWTQMDTPSEIESYMNHTLMLTYV